jgi:hypothetical protein
MKKTIAVILLLLMAAFILSPADQNAKASSGADVIYDKNSTGPTVVRIQMRLRELGYLNFKPTGSYKSMTIDAVKAFQSNCRDSGMAMQVDGRMGSESLGILFRNTAIRASLRNVSIPAGPKHGSGTLAKTGSLESWESVKAQLIPGNSYTITDCYTGKVFELIYVSGGNHAEMEPAPGELEAFMEICGKEFNYFKRPVIVSINGLEAAASIQCWPHGSDSIADNGMDGHVCLFFDGSLSNVGSMPDIEHTENIYKAAGK